MSEETVRRYAEMMREFNLQKLTVAEKGMTISLEKPGVISGPVPVSRITGSGEEDEGQNMGAGKESGEGLVNGIRNEIGTEIVSIKSPMVGVFYAAPAENEDPFVSVGDKIKAGDVVCIIEAMKLMSEISSEENGVIEKICVTNGQLVEFGTELMQIRKA